MLATRCSWGAFVNIGGRISFLEKNLARQLAWIAAADSKTPFVLAINTAMLGLLAAVSPKSIKDWTTAPAIFASLAAALGLAGLIFLSLASFPRTKGPKGSLVFFGEIAKRDPGQFHAAACDLSVEAYVDDLCAQCHRNATIASSKFAWVQRSLLALYLSIVPWCLAVYLLYARAK